MESDIPSIDAAPASIVDGSAAGSSSGAQADAARIESFSSSASFKFLELIHTCRLAVAASCLDPKWGLSKAHLPEPTANELPFDGAAPVLGGFGSQD